MHLRPLLGCLVAFVSLPSAAAAEFSLQDAYAAAEERNLELQLAQARSEEAGALRLEALSIQLARVSTQWSAIFNERTIEVPPELLVGVDTSTVTVPPLQTQQAYDGSITLVQPLLQAATVPAVQAAQQAWRAALAEEQRARQEVRAATAQAYWGLLAARAGHGVAQANVELAERQRALAQRRTDAGLEGRRAMLQAELGVSRATRDQLSAAESVVQAEEAWRAVLSIEPAAVLSAPPAPDVPATLEAALAQVEADRPDLRAASHRVEASRKERTAGDLGWAPTLDLALQARFNFAPTVFNPLPAQGAVGFQLNWAIFDGGRRIARSQQARARTRALAAAVDATARDARREVRSAWHRLQRARAAVTAVQAEVALAEEDLELAQRALDAGSGTLLEVQTARLSLAAARLAEIQEGTSADLAAIDLLLATGAL